MTHTSNLRVSVEDQKTPSEYQKNSPKNSPKMIIIDERDRIENEKIIDFERSEKSEEYQESRSRVWEKLNEEDEQSSRERERKEGAEKGGEVESKIGSERGGVEEGEVKLELPREKETFSKNSPQLDEKNVPLEMDKKNVLLGMDTVLLIMCSNRPDYLKRTLSHVLTHHPRCVPPLSFLE